MILQSCDLSPGQRYHVPGNVVRHGGVELVCVRVTDCNARFVPLQPQTEVKTFHKTVWSEEAGEHVEEEVKRELRKRVNVIALANQYHPRDGMVIRWMNPAEMEAIFKRAKAPEARSKEQQPGATTEEKTKDQSMPKENTNEGRAAYIHKRKSAGDKKADIFEGVQKRWAKTGKSLFDRIFDRKGHGNGTPGTKKKAAPASPPPPPAAKGKKKKGKGKTPAASAPPPPPAPASAPAAPAAPPVQAPPVPPAPAPAAA